MSSKAAALAGYEAEYDWQIERGIAQAVAAALIPVEALLDAEAAGYACQAIKKNLGFFDTTPDCALDEPELFEDARSTNIFKDLYVFAFYGVLRRPPQIVSEPFADIQHLLDEALEYQGHLPDDDGAEVGTLHRTIEAACGRVKLKGGAALHIDFFAALSRISPQEVRTMVADASIEAENPDGTMMIPNGAASRWLARQPNFWPTNL